MKIFLKELLLQYEFRLVHIRRVSVIHAPNRAPEQFSGSYFNAPQIFGVRFITLPKKFSALLDLGNKIIGLKISFIFSNFQKRRKKNDITKIFIRYSLVISASQRHIRCISCQKTLKICSSEKRGSGFTICFRTNGLLALSTRQAILLNMLTVVTSTEGVSDYNAAPPRVQALFLFDYVPAFGIKFKIKKFDNQKAFIF